MGVRDSLRRLVMDQIGQPRGLAAPVTARLLNRVNAAHNAVAVAQLSRGKGTVLELGFGGGVGLERLLNVHRGAVVAVDPSIEMVRRARRRFCSEVHGRRLSLLQGIAESLPLRSGSLDAVISVHSLYYWHDWEAGLREIVRTLAPSGALILGSGTKANEHAQALGLDRAGFRAPSVDDIRVAMAQVGLVDIDLTVDGAFAVLVGRRIRG
jgi:arsenite methyltransferase